MTDKPDEPEKPRGEGWKEHFRSLIRHLKSAYFFYRAIGLIAEVTGWSGLFLAHDALKALELWEKKEDPPGDEPPPIDGSDDDGEPQEGAR